MEISVVIPVHNEESNIIPLYFSLKSVMDRLNQTYEVIFVDDCSADNSLNVLKALYADKLNMVIISLRQRGGQSVAMQAGFEYSKGEFIITMDGDLQNSPKDIPKLIKKINKGFDVVCGWRYKRKDPKSKVLASKIANYLRRMITKENIHDFGCTLRIFKREILKDICLSGGMHRFFTLIIIKLGYKIGEVKVSHFPRKFGKTKYTVNNRIFESLVDFIRLNLLGVKCLRKVNIKNMIKEVIKK